MRIIRKAVFAVLLGTVLVLTPVHAGARARVSGPSAAAQAGTGTAVTRRKAALLLGGTVAMVTGFWITLYKRGKK